MNSKIQALRLDRTVISSLFLCFACALLVLGLAATDATASSRHKPKRISSAKTLVLPPAARCVNRNRITLRWHRIPHVRWRRLLVRVDGRHFKAIRHMTSIVRLPGLPSGTFVLSVAAVTSRGQRVSVSRRYNDCTPHDPKPGKLGAVPPSTGFPSGQPSPAEPSPPNLPGQPSSPEAGRYTVHNAGTTDYGFSFYVSSDGVELQDVSGGLSGRCAPGGSQFYHPFYIPEISIAVNGSFDGSRSEAGLVSGQAATFTYAFSGHFHGYDSNGRARVAGVLREDLVYANGVTYSCSSNAVPWSATS